MKRFLLTSIIVIFVFGIFSIGLDTFDQFKNKADKKLEKFTGNFKKDFQGDIFVNKSSIKLSAKIDGDVYLEDSILEVIDNGKITGKIYIKNSTLKSPTTNISAGFTVAELETNSSDVGIDISDIDKKAAKVEKGEKIARSSTFKYRLMDKLRFNILLFILSTIIFFVLKNIINEYKLKLDTNLPKYLGAGALFWVLFPFITILMMVTIIGIPVWLIMILILFFGIIVGFVVVFSYLGDHVFNEKNFRGFALGFAVVAITDFVLLGFDYFLSFGFLSYIFWFVLISISTGLTIKFVKIAFNKK